MTLLAWEELQQQCSTEMIVWHSVVLLNKMRIDDGRLLLTEVACVLDNGGGLGMAKAV